MHHGLYLLIEWASMLANFSQKRPAWVRERRLSRSHDCWVFCLIVCTFLPSGSDSLSSLSTVLVFRLCKHVGAASWSSSHSHLFEDLLVCIRSESQHHHEVLQRDLHPEMSFGDFLKSFFSLTTSAVSSELHMHWNASDCVHVCGCVCVHEPTSRSSAGSPCHPGPAGSWPCCLPAGSDSPRSLWTRSRIDQHWPAPSAARTLRPGGGKVRTGENIRDR